MNLSGTADYHFSGGSFIDESIIQCTPNNKEENKMRASGRKWEFRAPHEDYIDFEKIALELSGKNPVAFVEHGEVDKYVLMDNKILLKYETIGIEWEPGIQAQIKEKNYSVYKTNDTWERWVKWVREIRNAPWPKSNRKSSTVIISLPKV